MIVLLTYQPEMHGMDYHPKAPEWPHLKAPEWPLVHNAHIHPALASLELEPVFSKRFNWDIDGYSQPFKH